MKILKKIIYSTFLLLLFWSCGQKQAEVKTDLSFKFGNFAAVVDGSNYEAMLYGKAHIGGHHFSIKINSLDEQKLISIPRGTWDFFMVALPQGDTPVPPLCAVHRNIDANPVEDSFHFTIFFDNQACEDPVWGPDFTRSGAAGAKKFASTKITVCNDLEDPGTSMADRNCNDDKKGYAGSVKIIYPSFAQFDGQMVLPENPGPDTIITSACLPIGAIIQSESGGLSFTNEFTNIFHGSPDGSSPFPTLVRLYHGQNCESNNQYGFRDYLFPRGLAGGALDSSRSQFYFGANQGNPSDTQTSLFLLSLPHDICEKPTGQNEAFAFETVNFVGICNRVQFENVVDDSTLYNSINKRIVLLDSIDFNAPGSSGPNITPFGGINDDIFTGHFYGTGHILKNFSIEGNDESHFGLFRRVGEGSIRDLSLLYSLVEVQSADATDYLDAGMLIGRVEIPSGLSLEIKNIRAHGHTKTNLGVGGIIGTISIPSSGTVDISQVHFWGSADAEKTVSDTADVGGIVGMIDSNGSVYISQSSFMGFLNSDKNNAGGIVGHIQGSGNVTITESIPKGSISGPGNIGGFIGQISSGNVSISDSYSTSSLYPRDEISGPNVGGLIGEIISGATASLSRIFMVDSSVLFFSPTPPNSMTVDIGAGTATWQEVYHTNSGAPNFSSSLSSSGSSLMAELASTNLLTLFSTDPSSWIQNNLDYDFPRLAWEVSPIGYQNSVLAEKYIPYLDRPCSGSYGSQIGAGTASDPYWICTINQFKAMESNGSKFYVLMKDLDFSNETVSNNFLMTAGTYKLNGNGKKLINLKIATTDLDEPQGIFSKLLSGSEIFDLQIVNSLLGSSTTLTTTLQASYIGLLAGVNQGKIDQISTMGSQVLLNQTLDNHLYIGGLVGINNQSGVIENSEIRNFMNITLDQTASYNFLLGGVTSINGGKIFKVNSASFLSFSGSSTTSSKTFLAGISSSNDSTGIIDQVQVDRDSQISFESQTTDGGVQIAGAINLNQGNVSNISVEGKYEFREFSPISMSDGDFDGLINNPSTGSFTNSFFILDDGGISNLITSNIILSNKAGVDEYINESNGIFCRIHSSNIDVTSNNSTGAGNLNTPSTPMNFSISANNDLIIIENPAATAISHELLGFKTALREMDDPWNGPNQSEFPWFLESLDTDRQPRANFQEKGFEFLGRNSSF